MPELPEVETMVRGVRPHILGGTLQAIRSCRCRRKPISIQPRLPTLNKQLQGVSIHDIHRLGKRIVMVFANEKRLVIEPRMTGLLLLSDPPSREHLRLEFQLEGNKPFWFWDRRGLGTVRLLTPQQFAERLGNSQLGPDALAMTEADWQTFCQRTARPVKVALLEQKWVAGIGNLYASEILFGAKIAPDKPANKLRQAEIKRLSAEVQHVLHEAIRYEGSTLNDGTYRNALNQSGSYQNKHRVYMKAGELCMRCHQSHIEKIVQAQRSTFYCPKCQR